MAYNDRTERVVAIDLALEQLGGNLPSLRYGLVEALADVLVEGELPEVLAFNTLHPADVTVWVATHGRVVAFNIAHPQERRYFSYDEVVSIDFKTGAISGEIAVYRSDGRELLGNVPNDQVRNFVEFLQNKVPSAPIKSVVVAEALKRLNGSWLASHDDLTEGLPSVLWEGELPEMVIYDVGQSAAWIATDRRAFLFIPSFADSRLDFLGSDEREWFASLTEVIHYDEVSSIGCHIGRMSGEVSVQISITEKEERIKTSVNQARQFADLLRSKAPEAPVRLSEDPDYDPAAAAIFEAITGLDKISRGLISKREIGELHGILQDGEIPEMLVSGRYNNGDGVLVATDRRAVFVDKGLFGSLKVESFPYAYIRAVESKTGIFMGEINIHTTRGRGQVKDVPKDHVGLFADFLRNKVSQFTDKIRKPREVAPSPALSIADELKKFAELRDQGIITEEEFNDQKSRLLQDQSQSHTQERTPPPY